MEIDLALLADAATIDASGKLNILGVFDRISVAKFPAAHPHVALVLRFSGTMKEGGSQKVEIVLKDPDGQEMVHLNGEVNVGRGTGFPGGQVRVPQVLNFDRLVFKKPGKYTFEVLLEGQHHLALPLLVHGAGPGVVAGGRPPAEA